VKLLTSRRQAAHVQLPLTPHLLLLLTTITTAISSGSAGRIVLSICREPTPSAPPITCCSAAPKASAHSSTLLSAKPTANAATAGCARVAAAGRPRRASAPPAAARGAGSGSSAMARVQRRSRGNAAADASMPLETSYASTCRAFEMLNATLHETCSKGVFLLRSQPPHTAQSR
jgi:hypothetical protein